MMKCFFKAGIFSLILFVLIFCASATLGSAPVVHIGPKPGWLSVCKPYNKRPPLRTVEGGYYFQLVEHQVQVEKQEDYHHYIREIVTDAGIQNGSEISVGFDPAFEILEFHDITVWRDNKPQSRLSPAAFKVIADEKELSDFIYQGTYSALCILSDIRRGDRIEYSYTITGRNPIFGGKYCEFLYFQFYQNVQHQFTSLVYSAQRPLKTKAFNQLSAPRLSELNGLKRYEWEDFEIKPAIGNDDAPSWFDARAYAQVTEYSNWADVAAWALAINQPNANPRGELGALVKKMQADCGSNKEKYFRRAVQMVQNEVRYMGIEIGPYSHRANDPGKVYNQRYGDCKDKALLLVSVLQAGGIDAHMVLVNTEDGSHLTDFMPAYDLFNHAVAVATVNGKQVWVDATIDYQGGEGTNIYFPDYGSGLILKPATTGLTTINRQQEPGRITSEDLYTVKSAKSAVDFKVTTVYTGSEADKIRDWLASTGMNEVEKRYLDYYAETYPKIEQADSVTVKDDQAKNVLTTTEHYKIKDYFKRDSSSGRYGADYYADCIKRELPQISGQTKTPVAVNYPFNRVHVEKVVLPTVWDIESAHKQINRDAYKFTSNYDVSGDTLSLRYTFVYLKSFVTIDKVPEFKNDIKELTERDLAYSIDLPEDWSPKSNDPGGPLNQWMLNLALFIVLFFGVAGFFVYRIETPGIVFSYGANFMAISGWLILVAIGLVLAPISNIINLQEGKYFDISVWNALGHYTNPSSARAFFIFRMIFHIVLFCLDIFCLVLFIQRRDILPRFIIVLFICRLLLQGLNMLFAYNAGNGKLPEGYIQAIIGSLLAAVIWIPYFIRSERVKATFIVPYPAGNFSYEKWPERNEQHQ